MVEAYIGLGSNLGDRREHLRYALDRLQRGGCHVRKVSSLYASEPLNCPGGRFLNAVALVETVMSPRDVLDLLLEIEAERGRMRGTLSEARTLDLDLLLYGEDVIDEEGLAVPHPRMHERAFVLIPLAEVSPDLGYPTLAVSVRELIAQLQLGDGVDQIQGIWWGP